MLFSGLLLSLSQALCSAPFVGDHNDQCVLRGSASSWYSSRAGCNAARSSHLLIIRSEVEADQIQVDAPPVWIGAEYTPRGWTWTDGSAVNATILNTLSYGLPYAKEKVCLLASRQSRSSRLSLTAASCGEVHPYVCGVAPHCPYQILSKLAFHARIDGSVADPVEITSGGVLKRHGFDIGLGVWENAHRFAVPSPAGVDCTWVAEFGFTSKPTISAGCDGSLHTVSEGISIECDPVPRGITGILPGPDAGNSMRGSKTAEPTASTASPYEEGEEGVQPRGKTVIVEDDEGVPTWVWPVAFVSVALVSALVAIGATRRRTSGSSEDGAAGSTGEPEKKKREGFAKKTFVHDAEAAAHCATCKRFNGNACHERLKKVHGAMQSEFMQPLKVLDTRCEHSGADHIHHFTVENDYDAPCLGALSTVYSRTKPRLPRNTRIHIEKGAVPSETPEAPLEMPEGAEYYY